MFASYSLASNDFGAGGPREGRAGRNRRRDEGHGLSRDHASQNRSSERLRRCDTRNEGPELRRSAAPRTGPDAPKRRKTHHRRGKIRWSLGRPRRSTIMRGPPSRRLPGTTPERAPLPHRTFGVILVVRIPLPRNIPPPRRDPVQPIRERFDRDRSPPGLVKPRPAPSEVQTHGPRSRTATLPLPRDREDR